MKKLFWRSFIAVFLVFGVAAETNPFILSIYPSKNVYQGGSLVITAKVPPGLQQKYLSMKVFDKIYTIYPAGKDEYRLPLGIQMDTKPGSYKVTLLYSNVQKAACFFNVQVKKFRWSSIQLDQKNKGLVTSAELAQEAGLIGGLFRNVKSMFVYSAKKFVYPTAGKITSEFGVGRNYQDKATGKIISTWRHRGVDFGAQPGTPVVAINDGKVLLASMLKVHGGTIMIDHGNNIISIYSHVDNIAVAKGQVVKQGQKVAVIGSTGVSTGPHVHLGLSVANTRVDPMQWINKKMFK